MPTVTATQTFATSQASLTLKAHNTAEQVNSRTPASIPAPAATVATLRTLYNRAAHAFLHRDIPLTVSLIDTAFSSIQPPLSVPDVLDELRRKWDVLRITLESTVYSNPALSNEDSHPILKSNREKSPQDYLSTMYTRSLSLFTQIRDSSNPTPATLPTQVLVTLIYASLRSDCPDFGRIMVEDWLARREPLASPSLADNGYDKVLELYCLQILPKLEQWDYAEEFLNYETELAYALRENMKKSLKTLQAQAMTSSQSSQADAVNLSGSSLTPQTPLSRPYSPAPSTSSSSSSLSTTSTHTVVPSTVRGPTQPRTDNTPMSLGNQSTTSLSSDSTATPKKTTSAIRPTLRSRNVQPSSSTVSRHLSPPRHEPPTSIYRSSPSTYALIKAYLAPYTTGSSWSTIVLVFIVFPAISLLVRARHKNRQKALGSGVGRGSNASLTRQQLLASRTGAFNRAWATIVQSVFDTIKMAGSGLV